MPSLPDATFIENGATRPFILDTTPPAALTTPVSRTLYTLAAQSTNWRTIALELLDTVARLERTVTSQRTELRDLRQQVRDLMAIADPVHDAARLDEEDAYVDA